MMWRGLMTSDAAFDHYTFTGEGDGMVISLRTARGLGVPDKYVAVLRGQAAALGDSEAQFQMDDGRQIYVTDNPDWMQP